MRKCYLVKTRWNECCGDHKQNWVECYRTQVEAESEMLLEAEKHGLELVTLEYLEETETAHPEWFSADGWYKDGKLLAKIDDQRNLFLLCHTIDCGDFSLTLEEF